MGPVLRFTAYAAASLAIASAAGYVPTVRSAGSAGVAALAWAAALAFAGALAGYLPVHRTRTAPLERRAQAALVGVGVRLFATLAGLLVLLSAGVPAIEEARGAFLTWTAIDYVVLLAVETWMIACTVRGTGLREPGSGVSA